MSENEEPGFDPRFDPAFQRGFDTVPADTRRRHSASVQNPPAQYPPVQHQPVQNQPAQSSYGAHPVERPRELGVVPPPPDPSSVGSAPAVPSAIPAVPAIEYAADDAADDTTPAWRNPFLIALALMAVVLVGAGVWLAQQAREPFLQNDATAQADYMLLQIMMTAAPLVVVAGLATAIGVVFFLAADWQRRR